MFDRPLLIFSDYCIHSKNFLQILIKHPDLFNQFIRINIDVDPQTKKRPAVFYNIQQELNQKISKVPTIIVKEETKNGIQTFVLSDKEAFKWLDFKTKPQRDEGCVGFNPNEMNSFSDGYSKFGSTDLNDATEQNFKFYKQDISGKNVLPGENFNISGDINSKSPEMFLEPTTNEYSSSNTQKMYNNMEEERQLNNNNNNNNENRQGINRELFSIPTNSNDKNNNNLDFNDKLNNYKQESGQLKGNQSGQRSQIDFTNPNFGLSSKINNGNNPGTGSLKQKELDQKLQQLMQDRGNL